MAAEKTKTVRVLRRFHSHKGIHKPGETVELPAIFASEMAAARKVEIVESKPASAETSEAKPADRQAEGKPATGSKVKSRGGSDARKPGTSG